MNRPTYKSLLLVTLLISLSLPAQAESDFERFLAIASKASQHTDSGNPIQNLMGDVSVMTYQRDFNLGAAAMKIGTTPPPTLDGNLTHTINPQGTPPEQARYFFSWKINTKGRLGVVELTISSPSPTLSVAKPTLLVLAGAETSDAAVQLVSNPGDNYIVGLRYPLPPELAQGKWPTNFEDIIKGIENTPGHIALAIIALRQQEWVLNQNPALLGVSFGSIVLPAAARLAETYAPGNSNSPYILAYGGASAYEYLKSEWHKKHSELNSDQNAFIDSLGLLLAGIDPITHIGHLSGKFHCIHETEYSVIPKESSDALCQALEEPANEVTAIPGPHISPGDKALLDSLNQEVALWLRNNAQFN